MNKKHIWALSFFLISCLGCGTGDNPFCGDSLLNDPSGHWVGILKQTSNSCSVSESKGVKLNATHDINSECVSDTGGDNAQLVLIDNDGNRYNQESYSAIGGVSFVVKGEFIKNGRSENTTISYNNVQDKADVLIVRKLVGADRPNCEEHFSGQMQKITQ